MITKNDCLLLLAELSQDGIDTKQITNELIRNSNPTLEVVEFINKHRPFDVLNFYEKLRKSYNDKKSKLYKEIVQIDEKQPKDILITLSSLLTQIFIFSSNVQDRELFLKHTRAEEITKVITNYCKTYDLTLCFALLNHVKADLKALESIKNTHTI